MLLSLLRSSPVQPLRRPHRARKNSRANAPDDDFGIMISKNIEDIIAGRPGYEHVTFHRPEKWEEAVTVEAADGTCIGFTHRPPGGLAVQGAGVVQGPRVRPP